MYDNYDFLLFFSLELPNDLVQVIFIINYLTIITARLQIFLFYLCFYQ